MSGGSYNYLCIRDPGDLRPDNADLVRMVATLDSMRGRYPTAAADTRRVWEELIQAYDRIGGLLEKLRPVWKAVEWCDSGDWGDDRLHEVLTAYEGGPNRPCVLCLTAIVQSSGRLVDPDWGTDHRQRHSDIVGVCLDVEIANLVERLHQIGVRTEYSCEGYPDAEDPEHPYIMVANTAEDAHDLISKSLPEINAKTAYSSSYTFGVNEKANESRQDYYITKLTFPLGIPHVDQGGF